MRSKQLYKDVEIAVGAVDLSAEVLHKHHFFQIIYVMEGTGSHVINNNSFDFSKGDVFLLTPDDVHSYHATVTPVFCIIDFTRNLFYKEINSREEKMDFSHSFKELEYIFQHQHNVKGSLIRNADSKIFKALIDQLISEKENEGSFGKTIIQNIIFLLLNLIARNIQQRTILYSKEQQPKSKINQVTTYIQQHIYQKEQLKIEHLAKHFHISEGHLSRYFRVQTGSTLKEYITHYKLDIIQTRLKFSDHTISEIAHEMNFTDDSHLNKVFKKAFGITAKQYRINHALYGFGFF